MDESLPLQLPISYSARMTCTYMNLQHSSYMIDTSTEHNSREETRAKKKKKEKVWNAWLGIP